MTGMFLDKEKYTAALMYMLSRLKAIEGKKKLYKLFYFLDFDFFEAYDKSFTGETYVALGMGPAPRYLDALTDELTANGYLTIRKERKFPTHEKDTVIYQPKKAVGYKFTPQEKRMLDRVLTLYGGKTGKELEQLSHCQAPYISSGLGDVIPYEFAYYRDTPDLKS